MIFISDAIDAINKIREDAVVVSTMTANLYWEQVSVRNELDLPIFGAMGKASSVALGIAIARPDKKVLVLDGDGSLLMNLGTLVTAAGKQPSNLVHFVFDDGVYHTTGDQPVPGSNIYNFTEIARGAGIKESYMFDDIENFVVDLPGLIEKKGPIFVCLKVIHPAKSPASRIGTSSEAIKRVMCHLKTEVMRT